MENLKKMMSGFQDFVRLDSGVDGALFPGQTEVFDDDESDSSETEKVTFDSSAFFQTMMDSFGEKIILWFWLLKEEEDL